MKKPGPEPRLIYLVNAYASAGLRGTSSDNIEPGSGAGAGAVAARAVAFAAGLAAFFFAAVFS